MSDASQPGQKRVLLVYNPVAGLGYASASRHKIEERLKKTNWIVDVYETTGRENLPEVVRERTDKGIDLVVAVGGDGTVSGAASGIVCTNIPLAIIASGSGNIVAQELNIPLTVDAALDLICGENAYRKIDALRKDDHSYILAVSVGLSTRIMENTRREQKRRFGFLAYIYNGLAHLSGIKLSYFRLDVDGYRFSGWASEIIILNAVILGLPTFRQSLGVKPDDGKMEVCVIRSRTLTDLAGVLWNVLVAGKRTHPELKCVDVKEYIRIETSEPAIVEGDGDIIGTTPIQLDFVANAVRVIVPLNANTETGS
ncbi:MAG TPA: diacylglycerol kinase family protein [Levilinea sp.]|nr:diacylglycerol kinase family protein [Levilinea sp.]